MPNEVVGAQGRLQGRHALLPPHHEPHRRPMAAQRQGKDAPGAVPVRCPLHRRARRAEVPRGLRRRRRQLDHPQPRRPQIRRRGRGPPPFPGEADKPDQKPDEKPEQAVVYQNAVDQIRSPTPRSPRSTSPTVRPARSSAPPPYWPSPRRARSGQAGREVGSDRGPLAREPQQRSSKGSAGTHARAPLFVNRRRLRGSAGAGTANAGCTREGGA